MLDREHIIVSKHPQRRYKLAPPFRAMTIADGPENPRAMAVVRIRFSIENAHRWKIALEDLRVFRVDMENRIAQHANSGDRIDSLPKHVTRVVIAPDRLARDRPQSQHRFRVVSHKAGMHFDRDLHAMIGREPAMLLPVGSDLAFPLPLEQLEVIGRPRASDPVRVPRFLAVTRAPGEVDHDRHAELRS